MIEATPIETNVRKRSCPQCGTVFTCEVAAGQSQCWCFTLPRIISLDESDDKGCLCPACLGAKIAALRDPYAT